MPFFCHNLHWWRQEASLKIYKPGLKFYEMTQMTNDTNDNNYNKDADGDDNEEIHFLTADG